MASRYRRIFSSSRSNALPSAPEFMENSWVHRGTSSAANGSEVTILEDLRNGWYKIDYGNGKVGYASSDYIIPK